jgi:probable HAF family extracellular repeat protein
LEAVVQNLKLLFLIGLLSLTSVCLAQDSHAFLWNQKTGMQDLGTLGGSQSLAFGINSSGEVVGASYLSGEVLNHAFKWTKAEGMQDLGTLSGYDSSVALGVNTSGQIAGYAYNSASEVSHAVLWSADGSIQDLGTLGGASSVANSVNDGGEVTGYSNANTSNNGYAFLWTATAGMREIGGQISDGIAIGRPGAVGFHTKGFYQRAAMWTGSGIQDLGTLGGFTSLANGINATASVVGSSETTRDGDVIHGFVWTAAAGMKDLGTLAGGNYSVAYAINSNGLIAGSSNLSNGDLHAVLWTPKGSLIDLGTLGGVSAYGTAINASGQIAGYSLLP